MHRNPGRPALGSSGHGAPVVSCGMSVMDPCPAKQCCRQEWVGEEWQRFGQRRQRTPQEHLYGNNSEQAASASFPRRRWWTVSSAIATMRAIPSKPHARPRSEADGANVPAIPSRAPTTSPIAAINRNRESLTLAPSRVVTYFRIFGWDAQNRASVGSAMSSVSVSRTTTRRDVARSGRGREPARSRFQSNRVCRRARAVPVRRGPACRRVFAQCLR